METDLVKQLFSIKYAVADRLISTLPHPFRERVQELGQTVIRVIHETSGDYLKAHNPESNKTEYDRGLKEVKID